MTKKNIQCSLQHSVLKPWFRLVQQCKYRKPRHELFHPNLYSKNKSGQPHFCSFYCTIYSKNCLIWKTTKMWLSWLMLWRKSGMKSPLTMCAISALPHHTESMLWSRMAEAMLNDFFGHEQLTYNSIVFAINIVFLYL